MAELLSDGEIDSRLQSGEWRREGAEIVRDFQFKDFSEAIAFVNRVAEVAEAENHHPDIAVSYRKVTLRWTTHSAGGITERDHRLAARCDELVLVP
jgi:4a-hydroxytetrahydrobiopterin dehydratase